MIKKIIEVITTLNKKGYKAYLIGGASRDLLLSRSFCDVDIATSAPVNVLKNLFEVVNDDGKSLGSIKISFKGQVMELTRFRVEKYTEDSIYPHIEFVNDEEEDASRRDFTINAIYLNPLTNQIVDPFNGLNDLMSFKIRFINNPTSRIKEDPTRIFRAIRIASKLNFEIEENSLKAIEDNIDELKRIPIKKYNKEIEKTIEDLGELKAKMVLKKYNIEVKTNED